MSFTSNIFSTLGRCRILDEKHLDAVTALAGSGPAFAWYGYQLFFCTLELFYRMLIDVSVNNQGYRHHCFCA